ncbi:chromosome partition protein Smc [Desulfosarcina ovata subsp. sediminis]|uniref:Chromosome partition protein Smc n=1 Tax=Desulfosarcina ovata subsp. sediminis TaxID=885957 RepID=A0A5K7ZQ70_9BACT|nr:chromosome segregation protein SMC [Desulfosarcina ovata]BBO81540.1 chromosome partition protein Smc [Desulfosarcina ovata subsp. sediminis]
MKLKKLDIVGFKSFCEKASINFPPGICAVVGPNGCGKSNVVDALRWVMGEQSIKQLRGKDKEDIIFSGANGRPPLNLAEVSLTLVNDNGSMPEEFRDFSEVMVTRRLYRSGETAYLINKQPCRLKDIHNIFMGSGAGSRTYAVIQQGNIGAITDAGPNERRVFIEEAAGVTRYKMRKTEALRKVDATNQNLLRVKDIITEIDRQMAGLKRQAQKAERFKALKAEARQIDIRLLCHHDTELRRRMEALAGMLKSLKDEDIGQNTQLKQIDAAVEAIKLRRFEKDRDIAAQKSRKFEIQRKIDRMEADLVHLKTDRERLVSEVAELEAARTDLTAKNDDIVSEIDQVQQQHGSLQTQIDNLKTAIARENADSAALRDQIGSLNRAMETAKSDLMKMVAEEARVKNSHQNASNNRESLKRRLRRIDEETALAEKTVREATTRRETADAELVQIKNDIRELDDQIAERKQELDRAISGLSAQVKATQTLEMERNKAHSSLAALKKMEANLDWYKDGVKTVLKAAREPDSQTGGAPLNGIVGLLADVIEPATGWETAVEAALGESLQYILVQDQTAGAAAIDHLQQAQSGRCGFVPVGAIRAIDDRPEKLPDPEQRLLKHVQVKEGYAPVAGALLGHVAVSDTLADAREIYNRNGRVQTVVTRGGDLLSHQGVMIGGSPEKLSGILAKKQEIRSLAQTCAQLDSQAEAAHRSQTEMEAHVRDLEKTLQETISERSHAAQDAMEAEKALYRADEDLKNARRHLDIVRLEQEQLMGEEMDLDEEIERTNTLLATLARDVSEAQENVARSSARIDETARKMEDFNQRIVDLKLKRTSASANLDNCASTLRRLKDFQADGIRRLEQLTGDITAKRAKLDGSGKRDEILKRDLDAHYRALKELESRLSEDEKTFSDIDARLKESDARISEIQTQREELHQKIRTLEMDLAEKRIKRENLENRCQEYYHCAIADLAPPQAAESVEVTEPDAGEMEKQLSAIRQKLSTIGDVNLEAIREYEEQKERFDFLSEQRDDLVKAIDGLHRVIRKINRITQERFMDTFNKINEKLQEVFPRLFQGGNARLVLTEPDNPLETGVEFMVSPPGKKLTRMSLLSGGEKALSAISFIFSIFLLKPASFCLMDEIDAPLDDANVMRFNNLMKVIGEKSQIIMITHNKSSMEFADTLFGITMEHKGLSKVVSVNLDHDTAKELTAA